MSSAEILTQSAEHQSSCDVTVFCERYYSNVLYFQLCSFILFFDTVILVNQMILLCSSHISTQKDKTISEHSSRNVR